MIACEHPSIIVNPYVSQFLYKAHGRVTYKGEEVFKYLQRCPAEYHLSQDYKRQLSPRRQNVSRETADDYLIVMPDGTFQHLYLLVSCNKCRVCTMRNIKEWETRAMCETAVAETPPLFIRLSYDDKHVGTNDVKKEDIQDFFKRLRIQLTRLGYDSSKIRYAYCGEYGGKRGRAHYHAIIWNFPSVTYKEWIRVVPVESDGKTYFKRIVSFKNVGFAADNWNQILFLLERAWSITPDGIDPRNKSYFCDNHFELQGYIHLEEMKANSIKYIMKYIRKQTGQAVFGHTPAFFGSSRGKGGLGAEYLRQNMLWFLQHPDQLDFHLVDPFTGKRERRGFPQYFKSKIFATLSTLVPKDVRDMYSRYKYIQGVFKQEGIQSYVTATNRHEMVEIAFSFLPLSNTDVKYKIDESLIWFHAKEFKRTSSSPLTLREIYDNLRATKIRELEDEFATIQYKLLAIRKEFSFVPDRLKVTEMHKAAAQDYVLLHPYTFENLSRDIDKYEKYVLQHKIKERDEE